MPSYVVVRSKRRAKYSSSTLLGYFHEFYKFLKWLQLEGILGVAQIKDTSLDTLEKLSKEIVELYKEYFEEEVIQDRDGVIKKRSENAVLRNINALKSLFNYLTQETENKDGECYFYRNVFSKIKVTKEKVTANSRAKKISSVVLSDNEIDEFFHFVKFQYEKYLTKRQRSVFLRDKERDIAIISMLLGSGIRVSEIANLLIHDINFKNEQIDIIRKGNKEDTVLVLL
jgi:site-specific recombinase XerD